MTTTRSLLAARVLPAADDAVMTDAAVTVRGGLITWVGPQSELTDSGEITDLGDVTILPGLFDCHVHLSFEGNPNAAQEPDEARRAVTMASNALKLLDVGVTTARDLGSAGTVAPTVRDAIAEGLIAGPRLQVANAPLTVTGGHAWALGGEADGVTGVVQRVRQLRKNGADVLKIMSTGGFLTPGSRPWEPRFSQPELDAACDEAHRLGMRVTTHAQSVEGTRRAVLAGVDTVEHCAWVTENGIRFDPDVAALIAERGVFVCPTMNSACLADSYFCPWGARESVVGNLGRMRDAGIVLVSGTDCGIPLVPPGAYHDGLAVMAESGMTPREVIRASTTDAARSCGLDEITGALRPGLAADIIAVPGDPTTDASALATPTFVLAAGREHHPAPRVQFDPDEYREAATALLASLHHGSGRPALD